MSAASTQQLTDPQSGGRSLAGHTQPQQLSSQHCSPLSSPASSSSSQRDRTMTPPQQSASRTEAMLRQSSSEPEHSHDVASSSTAQSNGTSSKPQPTASSAQSAEAGHHQQSHASFTAPSSSTGGSMPISSTHAQVNSSAAPTVPQRVRLPTAAQRRRARELATVLLTLATCHGCSRPVQDPVTLPCGHSSCLQCIKDRVLPQHIPSEEEVQPLPCLTHLPPRLPLSPMTVPCPAHGCPRSAVGRGIGVWAGHMPRYGLIPTYTERLPVGSQDVGPGVPPVDGFVMGVADHPMRLTVIGPQTRSKAHLFAVPPRGVEPSTAGHQQAAATLLPSLATSNMLRTDVTLSKAVAILMRYASSPLPRHGRQRRSVVGSSVPSSSSSSRSRYPRPVSTQAISPGSQRARGGVRSRRTGTATARNSNAATSSLTAYGRGAQSSTSRRHHNHRPGTQAGMGIFGRNESDLESGTVGGVRAAFESDEEETPHQIEGDSFADDSEDDPTQESSFRSHRRRGTLTMRVDEDGWTVHDQRSDDEEEENDRLWPDHVGGAFSRPPVPTSAAGRRRGKAKRRRGRRSDDSLSSPTSFRKSNADKVAKRDPGEAEEVATSGWSTEDSTIAARLPSVAASDADTDLDHPTHTKPSLTLSSKLSPTGSPLVQTVATLHSELVEVLECQLCYLLLYNPLTTPCGHTFCKSCFARSLDHGDRCPLCRADMPNFSFFQDHKPNSALLKVLTSDTAVLSDEDGVSSSGETYAGISILASEAGQKERSGLIIDDDPDTSPHHYGFRRLTDQRRSTIEAEEREARLSTPIFVCTLAFPGMPTILHIFEPRYRLMVRRCLESGNPRFGMVLPSRNNGGTEEYGTMLEIKSVQMLADGRSMLETVGSYRFKLLEKGSLDGYTVGRVERVDDLSLEEEGELERQVMVRRMEIEREKAALSPSTSSAAPVAHSTSSSTPTPPQPQASGAVSAHPELSLYQPNPTNETTSHSPPAGEQEGLSPFKPVPPEPSLAELVEICTSFIETLQSGSAPWLLSRLNHTYGPMPSADEVERLGYWMALVMPIDEHEKAKLLPIRSRRLRLCLVVHWIEQLRQSWWFNSGCTVS